MPLSEFFVCKGFHFTVINGSICKNNVIAACSYLAFKNTRRSIFPVKEPPGGAGGAISAMLPENMEKAERLGTPFLHLATQRMGDALVGILAVEKTQHADGMELA